MSFKPTSVSGTSRKSLTVSEFGGVDYSKQRFGVESSRSIDEINYVYRDGVLQKRKGTTIEFKCPSFKYREIDGSDEIQNGINLNGLWSFKAEDGEEHLIAHVGNLLCEVLDVGGNDERIEPIYDSTEINSETEKIYVCLAFKDFMSGQNSAFVGANRLYFTGGTKFACLRFYKDDDGKTVRHLYAIENKHDESNESEDAYIPLTTIMITHNNSNSDGSRTTYDDVNLMTKWRKNSLITDSGWVDNVDESVLDAFCDFTLDSPLVWEAEDDMVDFKVDIEYVEVIR